MECQQAFEGCSGPMVGARYRGSHVDLVSCELQKRGLQDIKPDGGDGAIR